MVSDTLDTLGEDDMLGDSEVENEVDAILTEITGVNNKKVDAGEVPEGFVGEKPVASKPVREEESEDEDEEMLNNMRERLRALQS